MTICSHCGQDIPDRVQWKGLMVTALGDVFWRGIKLAHLHRTEAAILLILARRGEATHLALEVAVVGRTVNAAQMHITNIRRKLAAAGAPIAIRSIYGFGYRLEITESESAAA